jgi:hypothetical protein
MRAAALVIREVNHGFQRIEAQDGISSVTEFG